MPAVADPAERTETPTPETEDDQLHCCYVADEESEVCRECGCTSNNACVRQGEVCGWAEPGLCTACAPGAGDGWKHPTDTDTSCPNDAEYEIIDKADEAFTDGRGVTHACLEHVGHLLGHSPDGRWSDGDPEVWEVRPL